MRVRENLGFLPTWDVVPAGSGWNTDPYKPEIIDGIYAWFIWWQRSNHGFVTMVWKIIKDLGQLVSKSVRFVVGTDEESGWQDMDYYFEACWPTWARLWFPQLTALPIINGEKGISQNISTLVTVMMAALNSRAFTGGLRENMVPESATAYSSSWCSGTDKKLQGLAGYPQAFSWGLSKNGEALEVTVIGKSAHGSTPEDGINGATYLISLPQPIWILLVRQGLPGSASVSPPSSSARGFCRRVVRNCLYRC